MRLCQTLIQVNQMAFLKQQDTCDHCGKDLSDVDDIVTEDNHEFCSEEHREAYEDSHDHEDDDEEEVCQFC